MCVNLRVTDSNCPFPVLIVAVGAVDRFAECHCPGYLRLFPALLCFCQPGLLRSGTGFSAKLQVGGTFCLPGVWTGF